MSFLLSGVNVTFAYSRRFGSLFFYEEPGVGGEMKTI